MKDRPLKSYPTPPAVSCQVGVCLDMAKLAQMKPEQIEAVMAGVAMVASARSLRSLTPLPSPQAGEGKG